MDSFFEYTEKELQDMIVAMGYSKYSSSQIYDWVYRKKVKDFSLMLNVKKELRLFMAEHFSLTLPEVVKKENSIDTTSKLLLGYEDGSEVETVLMHQAYGTSLCVSSEVGCNMGCTFCASGLLKKKRNLRASEMVEEVMKVEEISGEKVTHVVIMGTGEPLDNLDNVLKFIQIINAPLGLEIGIRHITLSTSGIIPKIYELASKNIPINLAISLHAPTEDLRSKLMPINKAYHLKDLIQASSDYFDTTGRRITFEYLLLSGVNDSLLMADKLADLIKGMNCYVNLIPYNPVEEFNYKTSDKRTSMAFYNQLKKRGINVTLRRRMGDDISAACGQLRSKQKNEKKGE